MIFAKFFSFCYEGITKKRRYLGEVFLPIHVPRLMKGRIARNDIFQGLNSSTKLLKQLEGKSFTKSPMIFTFKI